MWDKTLKFSLITDFNVDTKTHTFLHFLQQNGVFEEYLLRLIEEDIKIQHPLFNDIHCCEHYALMQMGYNVMSNQDLIAKMATDAESLISELANDKTRRLKLMAKETSNAVAQLYRPVKAETEQKAENNAEEADVETEKIDLVEAGMILNAIGVV